MYFYVCIYILVYNYKRKNILNTNYTKLKYFLTSLAHILYKLENSYLLLNSK